MDEDPDVMERYVRLALKAQANCHAALRRWRGSTQGCFLVADVARVGLGEGAQLLLLRGHKLISIPSRSAPTGRSGR
ncbi:MAG TPA: hypothetical protein VHG30_03620 [Microvirga sp.]|nr:hypothetical protein [Microvirga sp.]